ncbi:MAG: glycosyltransferase family A protein [Lentisphaeria bacterium]
MPASIAVIIPCYNQGQYVAEAVDSILRQSYQDFEIIVVNDGSTQQATNDILSRFERPKTRILTTSNQGLSAARNNGIKASLCPYILTLDADDLFEPTFLEKAVAVLDTRPEVGVVTCWVQSFGAMSHLWRPKGGNVRNFLVVSNSCGNALFRRVCWEQVGGYNEAMREGFEDWDFWLSVTAQGWLVHTLQEALFLYRRTPGSMFFTAQKQRLKLIRRLVENNKAVFVQHVVDCMEAQEQRAQRLETIMEGRIRAYETSTALRLGRFLLQPAWSARRLLKRITKKDK